MAFKHNFTANGQSQTFSASGYLTIHQSGTYGGGTVTLQLLIPGTTTYESLPDTAKSLNDDQQVFMNGRNGYRLLMSGATAPDVTVVVMAENIRLA